MNQTGLLIFARNAREEVQHKQLFAFDQAKNIRFVEALNDKIKKTVSLTGIPYYFCDESHQVGLTFQERYKNAIENMFENGFERVIVVGNDCIELTTNQLLKVNDLLNQFDIIYGKTSSGGIYTLSFTKNGFQAFEFDELPWNTKDLAESISALSTDSYVQLPEVYVEFSVQKDIDEFIKRLNNSNKDKELYGFLFERYYNQKIPAFTSIEALNEFFLESIELRGPPELNTFQS